MLPPSIGIRISIFITHTQFKILISAFEWKTIQNSMTSNIRSISCKCARSKFFLYAWFSYILHSISDLFSSISNDSVKFLYLSSSTNQIKLSYHYTQSIHYFQIKSNEMHRIYANRSMKIANLSITRNPQMKFLQTMQRKWTKSICADQKKKKNLNRNWQLFEQDIGPLKRSLSVKTRRFSRISEIALVTNCFWANTCLKQRVNVFI